MWKNHNEAKKYIIMIMTFCTVGIIAIMGAVYYLDHHYVYFENEYEVQEEWADGDYNDPNKVGSDSDQGGIGTHYKDIEDSGIEYTILEIVPDERMAMIGYTIGGCEPVAETAQERQYIMDSLVNNYPGSTNEQYSTPRIISGTGLNQLNNASKVPASTYFRPEIVSIDWGAGLMTLNNGAKGYYLKVDAGKGVYGICRGTVKTEMFDGKEIVKNIIMESRYGTKNNSYSVGSYDYVWVDDPDIEKSTSYTLYSEYESAERIYLYDYYKTKYCNNEEFLSIVKPVSGVSGTKGIYDIKTSDYSNSVISLAGNGNYQKVIDYKKHNLFKVYTKTPEQLKDNPDEASAIIERADLIVVANSGDGAYDGAFSMNKDISGDDTVKGQYSSENDLTFKQVLQIYDKIVAKNESAIVTYANVGGTLDTNLRKLVCMLYYVDKGGVLFAGRDMFMDYLPKYVSAGLAPSLSPDAGSNARNHDNMPQQDGRPIPNGFMFQDFPWELNKDDAITFAYLGDDKQPVLQHYTDDESKLVTHYEPEYWVKKVLENGEVARNENGNEIWEGRGEYTPLYRSKSNITDYLFINDDGQLVYISGDDFSYSYENINGGTSYVEGKKTLSGHWFNVDFVGWRNEGNGGFDYKQVTWNNFINGSPYDVWPFGVIDGAIAQWWFATTDNDSHVPIYFHYIWGGYSGRNGIGATGRYKNEVLFNNTADMFTYGDDGKLPMLAEAIEDIENPREDHIVDPSTRGEEEKYWLSINIKNGDSVNKIGANKTLYVNDYELATLERIPLKFEIKTTDNVEIDKLVVTNESAATGAVEFTKSAANEYTSADGTITLSKAPDKVKELAKNAEGDDEEYNVNVYSASYVVPKSEFESRTNTKYKIEVYSPAVYYLSQEKKEDDTPEALHRADTINIVIRDMFDLN